MTFSEILTFLNNGFAVRRKSYDQALIIFKQIPSSVDNVSSIKSMPKEVKKLLSKFKVGIDYHLCSTTDHPIEFYFETIEKTKYLKERAEFFEDN
jgi:hypothetical protein